MLSSGGGTPWLSLRKLLCCEISWWTSWRVADSSDDSSAAGAGRVLRGSILPSNRLGNPAIYFSGASIPKRASVLVRYLDYWQAFSKRSVLSHKALHVRAAEAASPLPVLVVSSRKRSVHVSATTLQPLDQNSRSFPLDKRSVHATLRAH